MRAIRTLGLALMLVLPASAAVVGAGVWVARSDSPAAHAIVGAVRQVPQARAAARAARTTLAGVLATLPVAAVAEPSGVFDPVTGSTAEHDLGNRSQSAAVVAGVAVRAVAPDASRATAEGHSSESAVSPAALATSSANRATSTALPPVVPVAPVAPRTLLPPAPQQYQTMNNCGPASAAMALGYFGYQVSQDAARQVLRPGGYDDKNVRSDEIAEYLARFGIDSRIRVAGNADLLRRLLSNGIVVIAQQLLVANDDIGHYRIVRGYDDQSGVFISQDPYFSPAKQLTYAEFDRLWRPYNRRYLPLFRPEAAPVVQAILGDDWEEASNFARAQQVAENEINRAPGDAYAWFNLGDSHLAQGDAETAVHAYERALLLGLPRRHMWYQIGPLVAHNQAGNYARARELALRALSSEATLAEVHYEHAQALLGLGQRAAALESFRLAVRYGPNLAPAYEMLARLIAA